MAATSRKSRLSLEYINTVKAHVTPSPAQEQLGLDSLAVLDPDSPHASQQATPSEVHRLDAGGSVQALVVDDEILIAGLQGGQIAVRNIRVSADALS